MIEKLKIRDQGASNGCTVYSIVTINNLQNLHEFGESYEQKDPSVIYEEMKKERPDLVEGVYFDQAIAWMKKKGYIVGVGHITRKEQVMKAIDLKCYPLAFIKGVNRKRTGEGKKINREPCQYGQMKREEYSHAFSIVGPYTPDGVLCVGSWGSGRGENGYFHATWDDIVKCKSIVAVIDVIKGETPKKRNARFLSIIKQLSYV